MKKVLRLIRDSRPRPPADMPARCFLPSEEVEQWVRRTFIDAGATLANPRYEHLRQASIGFLWTDLENARNMRRVIGQCELMPPMAMGRWQRARAVFQIERWFGFVPDFLITFDAHWCLNADDASFCALVEHELHHAGIEGYKQNGEPKFAVLGHDVEEFVGVVERYGATATGVEALVRAANKGPTLGAAMIGMACGTCGQRRRG